MFVHPLSAFKALSGFAGFAASGIFWIEAFKD